MAKTKKVIATRNYELARGLQRFGKSSSYHRRGVWAIKKRATTKPADKSTAVATTKKAFQKGTRVVPAVRASRYYPATDVRRPKSRSFTPRAATLRASIAPGSVLILLAGAHRAKRVVCLGALPSGLLLVAGPFAVNGVPLRRVSQAYVLGTSTRVDVSKIDVKKYNDEYFAALKKAGEGASAAFKADVKAVDKALLAVVKKTPNLEKYLGAKFSLRNGDRPHAMKF